MEIHNKLTGFACCRAGIISPPFPYLTKCKNYLLKPKGTHLALNYTVKYIRPRRWYSAKIGGQPLLRAENTLSLSTKSATPVFLRSRRGRFPRPTADGSARYFVCNLICQNVKKLFINEKTFFNYKNLMYNIKE